MTAGWMEWRPGSRRTGVRVALLLALATIPAVLFYQYRAGWTTLQRYYLGAFLRSQAMAWVSQGGDYLLLDVIDRKGQRPAMDSDVIAGSEPGSYAVSQEGAAAGDQRLVWNPMWAEHAQLHQFLRQSIYNDRTPWDLARPACEWALGMRALGLMVALLPERKRTQLSRQAPWRREPERVEVAASPSVAPTAGVESYVKPSSPKPAPQPVQPARPASPPRPFFE